MKPMADPGFSKLSVEGYEIELIRDVGSRNEYKKGQVIYSPGDVAENIYLVESGLVRLYRPDGEGGRFTAGNLRGPGELIGMAEALYGIVRTCFAGALEDVALISVKKEDFESLLNCDPFFLSKVIRVLACETPASNP
ncbi:MAG: cyclic nucleotide-binding domain-containing protein [Peptococcaceae bacterium]|nr:cyclic nucleotide-binding domain-containing protein [Peptococcaceae bacterium]